MTVRLNPTESDPTPSQDPAASTDPVPESTGTATVPGADGGGADSRMALREARRQRRRTSLLCAAVVAACLALTIVVVLMARDRPVGTPSSMAAAAPSAPAPPAAPVVDVNASTTVPTRGATAPEGGNP